MHGLTQSFVLIGQRRPSKQYLKTLKILSYFLTTLKHMFMKALGIQSKILGESHGLVNAIDIWQPVDGGYAATLKTLINQEFFNWLHDEDNVEKWYGAESHIRASKKRILITKWVGNAYAN